MGNDWKITTLLKACNQKLNSGINRKTYKVYRKYEKYREVEEAGGEGNGNPLQCSCLENPGDGGAW